MGMLQLLLPLLSSVQKCLAVLSSSHLPLTTTTDPESSSTTAVSCGIVHSEPADSTVGRCGNAVATVGASIGPGDDVDADADAGARAGAGACYRGGSSEKPEDLGLMHSVGTAQQYAEACYRYVCVCILNPTG